jgi:hypothetical protein
MAVRDQNVAHRGRDMTFSCSGLPDGNHIHRLLYKRPLPQSLKLLIEQRPEGAQIQLGKRLLAWQPRGAHQPLEPPLLPVGDLPQNVCANPSSLAKKRRSVLQPSRT